MVKTNQINSFRIFKSSRKYFCSHQRNFNQKLLRYLLDNLVTIFISFFLILCNSCTEMDKFEFEKMETTGSIPLPSEAPDQWLLAHIDVETTGLLPGYHEMIDIGIVMTTIEGDILDSLFLRIKPQHPERLSPGAFEVNAFDPERWKELGAFSIAEAVDSIISFHKKTAGDKQVLMVANNSHFDAAFLDHLFRTVHKTWRELYYYYILDIPSMAWGLGFRDLNNRQIMEIYNIPDEPHIAQQHTGITGAMLNVRIYRALLHYRNGFTTTE